MRPSTGVIDGAIDTAVLLGPVECEAEFEDVNVDVASEGLSVEVDGADVSNEGIKSHIAVHLVETESLYAVGVHADEDGCGSA